MEEKSPFEFDEFEYSDERPPERWKSALSIVLMVVMVILLFRVLFALIVPIISIILLVANRDLVLKIVGKIYQLYQDELYKGLLATLASIFLFAPFIIFLFFRTVYYMFVEEKTPTSDFGTYDEQESTPIDIVLKEKMKDLLRDDDHRY